jgi:acyl CoA:acetate/3-ketoacid CoA transferase alpha subunit
MNENRQISLQEATALIQPGQTLALGGMTLYRRPVAFVYELLRRDPRPTDLTYNGEELVAFPALKCDVAVIHALVADRSGNARINGNRGVDAELALVAETVIVTAEEIVDELTSDVDIVGPLVKGVVHAPRGAWPTSCYPLYPVGGGEILRYVDACNAGCFDEYLASVLAR